MSNFNIIIDSKTLFLKNDIGCTFTIRYETLKNGIKYPVLFQYDVDTIHYELELACDYSHLFDMHLRTAMESFEPNAFLNELLKDQSNIDKGYYGLMILISMILSVHILLTDDTVAERTGHDYLLKPIMPIEITSNRIMNILPLFTVMQKITTGVEQIIGKTGYELGLLFLECFKEDPDMDYGNYNTAVSMILYQNFQRQIEKMDERMRRIESLMTVN